MGVWVNWGLVVAAIAFIFGDLVLEVYESVNLAVLGMLLLAGGILGLAIDSAAVGLGTQWFWRWSTWWSIAARDTCCRNTFPGTRTRSQTSESRTAELPLSACLI